MFIIKNILLTLCYANLILASALVNASPSDDELQRMLNEKSYISSQATPSTQFPLQQQHRYSSTRSKQDINLQKKYFLEQALTTQNKNALRWQAGWGAAYSGALVKSISGRNDLNDTQRVTKNVNLGTSLLALGTHLSIDKYPNLNSQNTIFKNSALSTQQKIDAAERLLKERADFSKRMNTFNDKLKSYAVSVLSTIIIASTDEKEAYKTFGLSILGIEASRRTVPKQAITDWEKYKRLSFDNYQTEHFKTQQSSYAINISPFTNGIELQLKF